jgi:multimeric flavodoxin WrbA
MKVVAIVGSPRATGNTSFLVDQALKEVASKGIETEKIMLCDYKINPCQGHETCSTFSECKQKDDAPALIEKFNQADAVILASPVYYYNLTAQIKLFIDRNYFSFTHQKARKAKYAGLIAVGGGIGTDETIAALKRFLRLPDEQVFAVAGYTGQARSIKGNTEVVEQAREMGRKIADKLTKKK